MVKLMKRITFMSICLFLIYLIYSRDYSNSFIEELILYFLVIIFSYMGIKNEGGS